jgi:hypothetical protein
MKRATIIRVEAIRYNEQTDVIEPLGWPSDDDMQDEIACIELDTVRAYEVTGWAPYTHRIELGMGVPHDGQTHSHYLAQIELPAVNWRNLGVIGIDGGLGTLGEILDNGDASITQIELNDDGSIDTWADHMIAAPDEEPGWDTPRVPVDWSGFAAALSEAITRL